MARSNVVEGNAPEPQAALPPVIMSKLRSPQVRAGVVDRPALVDRLRSGRERTLTLVCAPAGYGKSTLLAQWREADRERTPFVWLSLEPSDADPSRLWAHLIAGLHEAYPSAGDASLEALAAGPRVIAETVVPLLAHELADAPPLVVILDDWHLVRNPVCDATMASFVERAPEQVQIVVSSRADPGLSIARLRAHGELSEIRETELRISTDEALVLFLNADIDLGREEVERVNDRTEGWLAGVCLALLVVREREDRAHFVDEFSGDTRHVLDFLADDVLGSVRPEVRAFLLRTSVLDRLSAELCDAVLEISSSAALLAEIAAANLFLVSLDEYGEEYRYHHLFGAMLERELRVSEPDLPAELHARASAWFEAHGDFEAAVEHAIASRDVAWSSELVTRHAQAYWTSGRIATVVRWLESLAWPEAAADPQLAVMRADINGMSGHPREDVERWLTLAEAAPDFGPLANGLGSLRSAVALLRAAFLTRGLSVAADEARWALEREPEVSPWRGPMLTMLGQALYLLGRSAEAKPLLDEARALPLARAQAPATAQAMAYSSLIALEAGNRDDATRIARSALDLLDERHLDSAIAATSPNLAFGCILAEGSDLRAAVAHLERAVALAAPAGASYWHAHALLRLAAALHRLGETIAAADRLAAARADLDVLPDQGILGALYRTTGDLLDGRARRDGFLGQELSEAELRIARSLASGASMSEVARALYLSPNTVKTHRRSIYRKLGVSTRVELLERAQALDLPRAPAVDADRA